MKEIDINTADALNRFAAKVCQACYTLKSLDLIADYSVDSCITDSWYRVAININRYAYEERHIKNRLEITFFSDENSTSEWKEEDATAFLAKVCDIAHAAIVEADAKVTDAVKQRNSLDILTDTKSMIQ